MKVIEVNAIYGSRSTGRIVKDLCELLRKKGDIALAAAPMGISSSSEGFQIGNRLDRKWHALTARLLGKQGYASILATKRFLKWLDQQKPDLVHLHNLHGNFVNLNLLFRYLAKKDIPTVITMHDCWYFTGKCFHYVESRCQRWKTGCHDCPRNKLDIPSFFFDQTKNVHRDKKNYLSAIPRLTVVGCSDWICKEAKQSFLNAKEIVRIYNGVDLSVFKPTENAFRKSHGLESQFIILGMANKWLLKENRATVERVLSSMGSDDVLVLVGCDQSQVDGFDRQKTIICVDYLADPNELADVYSSADVFVNLTLADTLPTVNMESLCCGTPVITYDSCGSAELVDQGITGYVVPQFDQSALIAALTEIRNHRIDRARCRSVAAERFEKNQNYQAYRQLFCYITKGVKE